jgi:hypothetical protein
MIIANPAKVLQENITVGPLVHSKAQATSQVGPANLLSELRTQSPEVAGSSPVGPDFSASNKPHCKHDQASVDSSTGAFLFPTDGLYTKTAQRRGVISEREQGLFSAPILGAVGKEAFQTCQTPKTKSRLRSLSSYRSQPRKQSGVSSMGIMPSQAITCEVVIRFSKPLSLTVESLTWTPLSARAASQATRSAISLPESGEETQAPGASREVSL